MDPFIHGLHWTLSFPFQSFGAYVADPKSSAKLQAKQMNSTSLEQRLEEQRCEFEARFKALEVELVRLRDGRNTDKTEEVFQASAGRGRPDRITQCQASLALTRRNRVFFPTPYFFRYLSLWGESCLCSHYL